MRRAGHRGGRSEIGRLGRRQRRELDGPNRTRSQVDDELRRGDSAEQEAALEHPGGRAIPPRFAAAACTSMLKQHRGSLRRSRRRGLEGRFGSGRPERHLHENPKSGFAGRWRVHRNGNTAHTEEAVELGREEEPGPRLRASAPGRRWGRRPSRACRGGCGRSCGRGGGPSGRGSCRGGWSRGRRPGGGPGPGRRSPGPSRSPSPLGDHLVDLVRAVDQRALGQRVRRRAG